MGKCAESRYLKELIGYYGNMDTYTELTLIDTEKLTFHIRSKDIIQYVTSTWSPFVLKQRDLRACVVFSPPSLRRDTILSAE